MECFQKNPNLRISARKLLKVPWIASARRANSSAPSKPTEYGQAVKSVQEWNERLKSSPNEGPQRRSNRSLSSSLGSSKPAEKPSFSQPTNSTVMPQPKLELAFERTRPNPNAFRSPEMDSSDNWDDDFVSSINPMSFQLPQLRPHDNFSGLLSAEKLKSYSTFEPVVEEPSSDDFFDPEMTLKSPIRPTALGIRNADLSRPPSSGKAKASTQPSRSRRNSSLSRPNEPKTAILRGIPLPQSRRSSSTRPSNVFRENSVEDYSDLIAADDDAFQRKLLAMQVSYFSNLGECLLHHVV